MSLVNLSHVCSHLQNASLARLGLTSIPYTKLHLSLALLLHKQGFLSQVKLAGASPPASCFPPGSENNKYAKVLSFSDDKSKSAEAALGYIVSKRKDGTHRKGFGEGVGFGEEAQEFAMRNRLKDREQLEREGWHEQAAEFLVRHFELNGMELEALDMKADRRNVLEEYRPKIIECRNLVREEFESRKADFEREQKEIEDAGGRRRSPELYRRGQLWKEILQRGFKLETLRHFAGEHRFLTARQLALDGMNIDVMGVTVKNQPFEPPPRNYMDDPWQLEEEGVVTQGNRASRRLWLGMKYWDGMPVLRKARMLSKPTKRISLGAQDLGKLVRGWDAGEVRPLTQVGEIMAVNTSMGLMEIRECVERKLGGMVLCRIW